MKGREGILSLDRDSTILSIQSVAQRTLNLDDEWEYRRLLEVYDSLDRGLKLELIRRGLQSKNPEIVEAAQDLAEPPENS